MCDRFAGSRAHWRFVILAPLNASLHNSINTALSKLDRSNGISVNTDASFTSDQNYWSDNCSHGWVSDATCDVIVSRVQSCEGAWFLPTIPAMKATYSTTLRSEIKE